MATKIQVRRDTAANWTSANPTLSDGEIGYETDTGYMKIGDGTTAWSSLSYFTPGAVDGDNNTTYTISTAQAGSDANVTLTGSDATNDTITLVAGTNLSLTVAGDNITAAVDNDLSNYDNSTSAFLTNSTLSLTGKSIGELSDVNGSAIPTNGDVLAWDAGNNRWNPETQASIPTLIDDLTDVSAASPTNGDLLIWNGSAWANQYYFSSEMQFLSGLNTRRNIGYGASDYLEFPGHSAGGVIQLRDGAYSTFGAGRYYIHRIDADFVANITDGDVNFNRALDYKIIVNNYYNAPGTDIVIRGRKSDPSFNFPLDYKITANGVDYTYTSGSGSADYFAGINGLSIPGLTIGSFTDETWTNGVQITYTPQTVGDSITLAATGVNPSGWSHLQMTEREYTLANDNGQFGSPGVVLSGLQRDGNAQEIIWIGGSAPTGGTNRYDIYDIYSHNGSGSVQPRKWFVRHSSTSSLDANVLNGDLTGSVFADNSTLLVDGVSGSIPAANLTGALPALDGSALTNLSGLGIQDIVDDTTPQLGGNLDLNSNDITGTGNVSITGNATITGNVKTNGDNADFILENTNVNANEEVFGNIIATTGSVEYGKVVFKAGPDSYTDNGEVNWITRIQGSDVTVFEIKGSTLSKSGIVFNPTGNAEVDFYMAGATDGQLLYVDAGDDRVGVGKLPTQGKLDVDGDVYATAFYGDGSNLTGISGGGGLSDVVDDTTPQLGGSLDVNGQDIVSVSNGNITLTPNGAGVVRIDGTNGIDMESGSISIKNAGAESYVRLYCESSNAHYTQLQSAPHADYSGNVTVTLPAIATRLVGRSTTDTLTNKTFGDKTTFEGGVIEGFSDLTGATGVVAHDTSNGHIFRHTSIAADFTANFTNLGLTNDHGTMVSLMLVQGGTAYIPTAVQIGGAAQTILWQGGSPPSGTSSGTDIVSFSITQSGGSYTVLGQLTSYS